MNKVKGKLDELGRERTQLNVEKAALQREKEELQQQVEELAHSVEKLNRDKVMLERELEAEEEQVTILFSLGIMPAVARGARNAMRSLGPMHPISAHVRNLHGITHVVHCL